MSMRNDSAFSGATIRSAISRAGSAITGKTSGTADTLDRAGLEQRKNAAFNTRRHENIYDSVKFYESPVDLKEKSLEAQNLISTSLVKNELFRNLTEDQVDKIILAMKLRKIKEGSEVIKLGETGFTFYVIQSGTFAILDREGHKEKELKGGDHFGELALLYNCLRTRSVVAESPSEVWELEKDHFTAIMATFYKALAQEIKDSLRKIPLLEEMNEDFFDNLINHVIKFKYKKGEQIIKKGEVGNTMFFVQSGSVRCTDGDTDPSELVLQAGEYFGERALLRNDVRSANVVAEEDTECLTLDRDTFEQSFGSLRELLDKNLAVKALKGIGDLSILDDEMREKVINKSIREVYEDGEFILHQGDNGNKFFILFEGSVSVVQNENGEEKLLRELHSGDYFGEGSLIKNEAVSASIVAKGGAKCFALRKEDFNEILGGSLQKFEEHSKKYKGYTLKSVKIAFEDLIIMRTLGTGTFGRVKLVEHTKNHETYALKILTKAKVIKYDQKRNVMNEKNILKQLDHPFLPKLHATYKDESCLYMLLELVQGGELFSLLRKLRKKLNAKFYAACMLEAFEYLHGKKILYRDLKPENVLIAADGYVKLVDFGFAKKVKSRTYTLCGTPEYMAPEVILRKGYDKAVDYWSLGIVLYEMNFGWTPFADFYGNDHMVICKNILRSKLRFPKHRNIAGKKRAMELRDLLKALLNREPIQRLGNLKGGAQDIKNHEWWGNYDFKALYSKKIKAPWLPTITSPKDDSNFDKYDETFNIDKYVDDGTGWDAEF